MNMKECLTIKMKAIMKTMINNMRILSILLVSLMAVNAWGTDWSYTFSSTPTWSPNSGTTRSMTINSATWSVSTSNSYGSPSTWGSYGSNYGSGGIKFGDSKNNYYGTITLSTDYFSSSLVSEVTVNLLINGSVSTTITVTQGSTIGSPSYNIGNDWHDFTANTNIGTSGTLTLTITTTQAIYIHSIAVTYSAAVARTVTFNKQGGSFDDPSFDSDNTLTENSPGAGVELPLVNPSSACAPEGWGFYGWATAAVASSTTTAPTIVGKAGDTYHPSSNITLHAVFAKGEYTKITSSGDLESDKKYIIAIESSGGDYYVVTDSYSYSSVGEIKCEQISETLSNKYSAAAINANWRYSIEGSGTYYIRDVVSSSSNNYVDFAYVDFYGSTEDDDDMYTFTFDEDGYCLIENDYAYAYFDETNYTFTRNNSDASFFFLYKETSTPYYNSNPSCCEYEVSVSESGSSHITSMAFSESSVATCGDASSRTITITVTPASGYTLFGDTKPVFTKTSGTATATIGSVTDNGNGTFSYECTFNSNDNGAGTFAISPGQFTNYRTTCCVEPTFTITGTGKTVTEGKISFPVLREDLGGASTTTWAELPITISSNSTGAITILEGTGGDAGKTAWKLASWESRNTDGGTAATSDHATFTNPSSGNYLFKVKTTTGYTGQGTYRIGITQAADETYCEATVYMWIDVTLRDKFVDDVNANATINKDGHGAQLKTPAESDMDADKNDDCNSTTRRLIGWIKETDLQTMYGSPGETGYLEDAAGYNASKVVAPYADFTTSGCTWYAVWGVDNTPNP